MATHSHGFLQFAWRKNNKPAAVGKRRLNVPPFRHAPT
jgi:hypothetical protein